jgi:hypothetical protein
LSFNPGPPGLFRIIRRFCLLHHMPLLFAAPDMHRTLKEIAIDYVGHMQMHLDDLPVDVSDIKRYPYPKA